MKAIHIDGRALAAALHDGAALALACVAATLLLDADGVSPEQWADLLTVFAVAIPTQVVVNLLFGVYQGIWRYTSLPDIQRIIFSVLAGTVCISLALRIFGLDSRFDYRGYILYPMFLVAIMSVSRMALRSFREWALYGRGGDQGAPVVILGAGDAAVGLVKELSRSHEWRVVGLLDDDEKKAGRLLQGARVVGGLEDLPRLAQRLKVRHAIIAMPSMPYKVRRRVVEICKRARVSVMTVPTLNEMVGGGKASPARVRKVALEDLMKREPVTLDDAGLHDLLTGQVVLVTGAGGSIGSELCRQIAAFQPAMLVLYEVSEYAIYKIDEQLREVFPDIPVTGVVGDIKNARRVNQVMHQYSPSLVFHAAAYKHVPLMERHPGEAVKNIVCTTRTVADLAKCYSAESFVLISTDKAVNPSSVMGACKRFAELYVQSLAHDSGCRFVTVRFGNVLDSAGSVVPVFREQIARGGPLTVTHEDMRRFFMTIPEASQLVIQAAVMGRGGEIFVLDMGSPVRIVDLARDMIRLSGLREGDDISIEFVGLRPGEKLFEQLLSNEEKLLTTDHPKILVAESKAAEHEHIRKALESIERIVEFDAVVLEKLRHVVPEFQGDESDERPSLPLAA